jgi:DNA-binding LytR/AlgR family response regulator
MYIKTKLLRKKQKTLLSEAEQNLICLVAESNYTHLIFEKGKSILMAHNLAVYDELLPDSFLRVNRSCTINKLFIKEINFHEQSIVLKNNTEVNISRRRWLYIKENLKPRIG